MILAVLVASCLRATLADDPGTDATDLWDGFSGTARECVSQEVRGVMDCLGSAMSSRLREAEQEERFAMLGGLLQFERIPVVHGTVIRTASAEYRVGRQESDDDLLADVDSLTRKFVLRANLLPGVDVRLQRRDDTVNVGLDLEEDNAVEEGRGKNSKKSKLKKFLPLLLIPIAVQVVMLPMTLAMLKLIVVKAILASKFALILVLVNGLWNLIAPRHDDMMTKMSQEHYGYDGNLEYGAYVNRRALLEERDRALWRSHLPYRGHK